MLITVTSLCTDMWIYALSHSFTSIYTSIKWWFLSSSLEKKKSDSFVFFFLCFLFSIYSFILLGVLGAKNMLKMGINMITAEKIKMYKLNKPHFYHKKNKTTHKTRTMNKMPKILCILSQQMKIEFLCLRKLCREQKI